MARYGHQQVHPQGLLGMRMADLRWFAKALSELLSEERGETGGGLTQEELDGG